MGLLDKDPKPINEIRITLDNLHRYLSNLEIIDNQTERLCEEANIDETVSFNFEYRHSIEKIIAKANIYLIDSDSVSSKSSSTTKSVKLPKLELPTYDGDVKLWPTFWQRFTSLVDSQEELATIDKFSYLLSSLKGIALRSVSGLSVTNDNYAAAIARLKKRFGNPDAIIQAHVNALFSGNITINFPPGHHKYVESLWKFYDYILNHVQGLDAQGIKGYHVEVFLCPLILGKLPMEIRLK